MISGSTNVKKVKMCFVQQNHKKNCLHPATDPEFAALSQFLESAHFLTLKQGKLFSGSGSDSKTCEGTANHGFVALLQTFFSKKTHWVIVVDSFIGRVYVAGNKIKRKYLSRPYVIQIE
jgi:hypothetical protein